MDQPETPQPDTVERDTLTVAKERFRAAVAHQSGWREEAEEDFAFVAGDQWDADAKDMLKAQLRPCVTFNRVAPMVDAVAGHEVSNRQEVRYFPRELGDAGVNELLTGAAEWVRDEADAEDEESDAFFDSLVCGMGWIETRLDWETEPDGEIKVDRTDPFEVWWDPAARKRNLVDARYLFRVKRMSLDDVTAMFPDFQGVSETEASSWGLPIADIASGQTLHEQPGDHYASESDTSGVTGTRTGIDVIEYQWCDLEKVVTVTSRLNGQVMEMTEDEAMPMLERMAADPGLVTMAEVSQRSARRYYRAFFAGNQTLYEGASPDPERFTYQCITGKRDRNNNTWYGLVRPMKDPQRWANKFFSQILHQINVNSKGGVIAEEGAFTNPRKAEAEWSRADSIIWAEDGAIANRKIMEKPVHEVSASIVNVMNFAVDALRQVTGVNMEMLGMAERQQAGVLEYQRRQAGLTILATMFDSLRRYRKQQGRVLLCFITKYISDGRLVRITGQDGNARYVPLVRDPSVRTYDVIVDEAPSSPNQKERVWQIMSQMLPILTGVQLPPQILGEILRYSPLPESFVTRIVQGMQQVGQDPAAEAAKRIELEKGQAEVRETHANATLDETKALVERAMLPAKQAETLAKAQASRANGRGR